MAGSQVELGGMFGRAAGGTLFGLPRASGQERGAIVVIGASTATPYASVGAYCAGGPAAIRRASSDFAGAFAHVNFDFGAPTLPEGMQAVDAGDLAQDGDGAANRGRIAAAVSRVLAAGGVPVLIGGDDSVPLPMIGAFEGRGPVWILQIDAHIDWRDEVEGERFGLSSTMRRACEMAHVAGIVQIGQRGIGSARPGDLADAKAAGVTFVPARELRHGGIARAAGAIPEGAEVVVCLDCDALDPSVMPAVIARTAGGLFHWDVVELLESVTARARIVAFDLVEFMPERDVDGIGATAAAELLAAAIGIIARQPTRT